MEFDIYMEDQKQLMIFGKMCEGLTYHSDTVFFKIKEKGLYIMVTDFEGFFSMEIRIDKNNIKTHFFGNQKEYTFKISATSLWEVVRTANKKKSNILFYCSKNKNNILQMLEIPTDTEYKDIQKYIKSTLPIEVLPCENKSRVFFILSSTIYKNKHKNYSEIKIKNYIFNNMIDYLSICSGFNGGVAEILINSEDNMDQGTTNNLPGYFKNTVLKFDSKQKIKNQGKVTFFITNQAGSAAKISLWGHYHSKQLQMKKFSKTEDVHCRFLLVFFKRSQYILRLLDQEMSTIYVSDGGIFLQTDKTCGITACLFTVDISNIDIDSYA